MGKKSTIMDKIDKIRSDIKAFDLIINDEYTMIGTRATSDYYGIFNDDKELADKVKQLFKTYRKTLADRLYDLIEEAPDEDYNPTPYLTTTVSNKRIALSNLFGKDKK
jgi:hypothetical protein